MDQPLSDFMRAFLHLFLAFFFLAALFTDINLTVYSTENAEVDGYLCMLRMHRLFIQYFINILCFTKAVAHSKVLVFMLSVQVFLLTCCHPNNFIIIIIMFVYYYQLTRAT